MRALPRDRPFALRARLLSPLADGGLLDEPDGLVEVDAAGRIARVGPWPGPADAPRRSSTCGRWSLLPGMVDLHVAPAAAPECRPGRGLDLLTWLDRYIFPLERPTTVGGRAPGAGGVPGLCRRRHDDGRRLRGALGGLDRCGLRGRRGARHPGRHRQGDDGSRHATTAPSRPSDILETSLRQSDELAARWHGRDDGRLRYAFTPRFAVSCSAEMLRESAALARATARTGRPTSPRTPARSRRCCASSPSARDYLDVYDRADALGPRTILAHAIHLSDARGGPARGDRVARRALPGIEPVPLERDDAAGRVPRRRHRASGLGSDVAAGPEVSMFTVMRAGAVTQRVLELTGRADRADATRAARLAAARDAGRRPRPGHGGRDRLARGGQGGGPHRRRPAAHDAAAGRRAAAEAADDVLSRLVFRPHPNMVRAAWVRGRLLAGPPGLDAIG